MFIKIQLYIDTIYVDKDKDIHMYIFIERCLCIFFTLKVNEIMFFRDQFKVLLCLDHFYIDKDSNIYKFRFGIYFLIYFIAKYIDLHIILSKEPFHAR